MELHAPTQFPAAAETVEDTMLTEVDIAIAMVGRGAAIRVRIASIETEVADAVAGIAAARAGAAGLRFRTERSPSTTTFTLGPRA
jgi:hypothetical protein